MALQEEFERTGGWLFRYRSYVPFVVLPLIAVEMAAFHYVGGSHVTTEIRQVVGLAVSLAGLALRAYVGATVPPGTSGRNTVRQVADALNTTGMYSVVRHPLYFANYVIWLGFMLAFLPWAAILIITLAYALYYERIMFAEEAFLRQTYGAAFESWASGTPAILPRWRQWRAPSLPFCWRCMLRREYAGFLGICVAFFIADLVGDALVERRLKWDWGWALVAAAGVATYVVLRALRRHTRLLDVPGR